MSLKVGRPTIYTEELAQEICETLGSGSKGVCRLCKEKEHWPNADTVFTWVRQNKKFSEMYHQARIDQITTYMDEVMEISDETAHLDPDRVASANLRINTRKWMATRLLPRLYGDKALLNLAANTEDMDLEKIRGILQRCMKPVD